jgi:hypothetical protein
MTDKIIKVTPINRITTCKRAKQVTTLSVSQTEQALFAIFTLKGE